MKKIAIRFLLISLLISPLIFSVGTQFSSVWAEDIVPMKATIVKVSGNVRILNHGNIFWHDAKVNEVIGTGSQIETKENGQIEIKLDNNNVIDLKPNTKLILRKLTTNLKTGDYENLLESNIGKIRAKVEKIKGKSRFEVKTPTAVACVRGTIMYLVAYPDSTIAFFEEGTGFVTNPFSGQTFDVEPGNVYQIDENGNVTGPVAPTSEQLQELIEGWNAGSGGEGYSEGEGGDEGGDDSGDDDGSNDNSGDGMDGSQDAGSGPGGNNTGGGTGTITDTDGDGIPDSTDDDDDGDGYSDADEAAAGSDPLLAADTPLDTDGDGARNYVDDDDDGDTYADGDDAFPLDENEWWDTDGDLVGNNADPDDDGDFVLDIEDAFPIDPDFSTDPNVYGSRNSIRDAIFSGSHWDIGRGWPQRDEGFVDFGDYTSISFLGHQIYEGVSGGIYDRIEKLGGTSYDGTEINDEIRNELRRDIWEMLEDQNARYLDSVMEKITDAQTGKVLTDAYGYRVRVEQYVLRPDSYTVELLNISLRTQEAGSLAGLNTLDWKTTFNKSLDALTSEQIRGLPWTNYLDSYEARIISPSTATAGSVYPDNMSIELRNGGNYLRENTNFNTTRYKDDGRWWQNITSKTLSFDLAGIGRSSDVRPGGNLNIKGRVTEDEPDYGDRVSIQQAYAPDAPNGFKYRVYFGSNDKRNIYVSFHVISDNGPLWDVSSSYDSKRFNTLGDALRANLVPSKDIGDNNLQITVSSKGRNQQDFENSRLIDVIYVPMPSMTWSDINWNGDGGSPK